MLLTKIKIHKIVGLLLMRRKIKDKILLLTTLEDYFDKNERSIKLSTKLNTNQKYLSDNTVMILQT